MSVFCKSSILFNFHKYFSTSTRNRLNIKKILECKTGDEILKATGWVQSVRKHKEFTFFDLNDGTVLRSLQLIVNSTYFAKFNVRSGYAVEAEGQLRPSSHPSQIVEFHVNKLNVVGTFDSKLFPFQSRQDSNRARQVLHLRSKIDTFRSSLRVRSDITAAVHRFFKERDFIQVHTPILTSNDCEGAGDLFSVHTKSDNLGENKLFFDGPSFLTCSGQLHLEAAASGISNVYNFNPAFRAEHSETRRHLAEFYMIEAETSFINSLDELLQLIEEFVRFVLEYAIDKCAEDIDNITKDHRVSLEKILSTPFVRLTYDEALNHLRQHADKLSSYPEDSGDLNREQELMLVTLHDNVPVFVSDYPARSKPFYMKSNGDQTVASVDLLAPYVGELCGGSLRENCLQELEKKISDEDTRSALRWYLDLRRFGSPPHGGFGLGFERILQLITGQNNIKDVTPFPRWSHHCKM